LLVGTVSEASAAKLDWGTKNGEIAAAPAPCTNDLRFTSGDSASTAEVKHNDERIALLVKSIIVVVLCSLIQKKGRRVGSRKDFEILSQMTLA
jgi:hypothetical protein